MWRAKCDNFKLFLACLLLFYSGGWNQSVTAQETASSGGQKADGAFKAQIANPRFAEGAGPTVAIDEAHHNFHTLEGRYGPFAQLLSADGYHLQKHRAKLSTDSLDGIQLLVIANPLAKENVSNWSVPTPSAFEASEIAAVRSWVEQGGSLLLIADHMPFPGAAERLAQAFGVVEWRNGFAASGSTLGQLRFDDGKHQLKPVPGAEKKVAWVRSFTGSCFKASKEFLPLMILGKDGVSLEPATAWKFNEQTVRHPVGGYLQGAVRKFGKGRVAFFGEAAMFTAQESRGKKAFGLNDPKAEFNQLFLRQVVSWLTSN